MDTSNYPFKRSVLSWTLYLFIGLFTFSLTMISPAIPFLRAEFHLDYTMAAMHLSMFAFGMVIGGIFSSAVLHRIGYFAGLWGGIAGLLGGAILLVVSPSPWLTLGGILLASMTGTLTLAAAQASLASLFPTYRAKALMEANVVASLFSAAPAFLIIAGSLTFLGWRIITPALGLAMGLTFLLGWRATHHHSNSGEAQIPDATGRLPLAYWINLLLIFFGVSTEWCAGFWSAEYLKGLPGGSLTVAAAGTGVFQVAAVLGRLVSSRIAGKINENRILVGAIVLVAIGFPLYWLRADVVSAFVGLALCGAGTSTFYPLAFSLAIDASGRRPRRASSFAPVASGLAIGFAPLLLGRIADTVNLEAALWAIPVGLLLMVILLLTRYLATRKSRPA